VPAAIDRYLLPARRSAANPPAAVVAVDRQTNRQTDIRPLSRLRTAFPAQHLSTLTAVRRSQLLARWPGTHSRILHRIQRAAQTVLGVYLKRNCSRVTSASSALGVLNDYVPYTSMHSLTHSLTMPAVSTNTVNTWLVHLLRDYY